MLGAAAGLSQKLIPARGLKPDKEIDQNLSLAFPKANPRKGTETADSFCFQTTGGLSQKLIPARGLKPISFVSESTELVAFPKANPRKGTETYRQAYYWAKSITLSQKLIPARGLKQHKMQPENLGTRQFFPKS